MWNRECKINYNHAVPWNRIWMNNYIPWWTMGLITSLPYIWYWFTNPASKVHGANMGPNWGRQDPGEPHIVPMKFVTWVSVLHWSFLTVIAKLSSATVADFVPRKAARRSIYLRFSPESTANMYSRLCVPLINRAKTHNWWNTLTG